MKTLIRHPFLRSFGTVLMIAALVQGLVIVLYLANPHWFYYRAWEYYFMWANFTAADDRHWAGIERSDLGRRYFFKYQEARETRVSTDGDGFRSVPAQLGKPRIFVQGRSNVFGSGVSDDETYPWQLAEQAGVATFNGAHGKLLSTLSRPGLEDVRLVVDVYHERNLSTRALARQQYTLSGASLAPYAPLASSNLDHWRAMMRPIVRPGWWLPDIIARQLRRLAMDFKEFHLFGSRPYLAVPYRTDNSALSDVVAIMAQRRQVIESLGLDYLALVIPSKLSVYQPELIDQQTLQRGRNIVAELQGNGFPVVNLFPAFMSEGGSELIFQYDSHWNARGQALAAELTVAEIRRRWPELIDAPSTSSEPAKPTAPGAG